MQFLLMVIGIVVLVLNDYTNTWSSILFPIISGIFLVISSLYFIITKKSRNNEIVINYDVYKHLLLLITTLVILYIFNIYFSTIWYILCYKFIDKNITLPIQSMIIIILLSIQYSLKTFLYFNI